jgi:stress response protein YsnF
MTWLSKLNVGMQVYATDGLLGSIASVPRVDLGDPSAPAEVIVLANQDNAGPGVEEFRRVTRDMIERVEPNALYLNVARRRVPAASDAVAAAHRRLPATDAVITIPVVEERVDVDTRVVELGYVAVRKKVDEFLDERAVALQHHEVEIERVIHDEVVPEFIQPYMDGDVYVVPVIEEEIVVQRRLRLKEELRIRRNVAQREEHLHTPYRRERVTVEQHWYVRDDADQPSPASVPAPDIETRVFQRDH